MKFLAAVLLSVSFVGIAVFGFLGMTTIEAHSHVGCLAATAQGARCPEGNFASVTFHFDALKKFSTAVVGGNLVSALFLVVLLFALNFAVVGRRSSREAVGVGAHTERLLKGSYSPTQNFVHWLALHENSPCSP